MRFSPLSAIEVVVAPLLLAALLIGAGCLQSVNTGGKAPFIQPNAEPLPEVFLDFDLATLQVEIDGSLPVERVRVGDLFGLVFAGSPQADYTLELIDYDLIERMPHAPLLGTHVRFECEVTVRLKSVEGIERVLTATGQGGDAAVAVQEQSVREAMCRAVEDLAAQVRYQIAPVGSP